MPTIDLTAEMIMDLHQVKSWINNGNVIQGKNVSILNYAVCTLPCRTCCSNYLFSSFYLDDTTFNDQMYYDSNVPCIISCSPDLISCDLFCSSNGEEPTTTVPPPNTTTASTTSTTTTITTTTAPSPTVVENLLANLRRLWANYRSKAGVTALTVTGLYINVN